MHETAYAQGMNSMSTLTTPDRPIQLHWNGGKVVVTPEDENRFVKEAAWAVSACQSKLAIERYIEQLSAEFFPTVREWCVAHSDRVQAAFVPLPTDHFHVFVVSRSPTYDFELSEPLADLESNLLQKNWPCEVLQIPACDGDALQTFFNPEGSVQVYGEAE